MVSIRELAYSKRMARTGHSGSKLLAENRRARFDYEIIETLEAGIELLGLEVKSIRAARATLAGSYAVFRKGEIWLLNCQIPPYQTNNTPTDYEPTRSRRLLLRREEVAALIGKLKTKGVALVALALLTKHGLIKVRLGLGRSRNKSDKRELLRSRAADREIRRVI